MSTTLEQLATQLRAAIAAKLTARGEAKKPIDAIRAKLIDEGGRAPSEAETTELRNAQTAVTAIDAEIEQLRSNLTTYETELERDNAADQLSREVAPAGAKPAYDTVVNRGDTKEPRTYTARSDAKGETSFFRDAYNSQFRGDINASSRLQRHAREVQVEGEMTERATTTGSFAGLVVPQYLVDQAALLQRAGRPFANTVTHMQLPEQGMSFQVPRGTTGASVAVQAAENTSVSSTDEVWGNLTVNVATVAGQQDVSRQSLERGTPGIDQLIYMDLAGAYGVGVDAQVLSGSGSSGQVLGVLNTAGVNQATAFTAAATPTTLYSKFAGQVNAIETTRFLAPDHCAMHPRRWNWLISQVDSQGRPLAVPNPNGPFNAIGTVNVPQDTPSATAVGTFQGLPVITDASIPGNVGTGPEDQIIVYRAADLILWEDGDGMPKELRFEQTLGNQLTVKLVIYGYIAFTAGRYPTAVGIVGGNAGTAGFGLAAPSF